MRVEVRWRWCYIRDVTRSRVFKALLVVLILAAAAMFYPPLRLSALVLAGRSPVCPLGQAVKSEDNLREQIATKDRILAGSKVVAKDGTYEQWQTPRGTFWTPAESRYSLHFHLAEQERRIYGPPEHFVKQGDIVLDCGANIGVVTREALNAGAAKVVAIEPAPENLESLRRNFAPEIASGRVVIYTKGVWDKDDVLEMHFDHDNSAADSFVLHPEQGGDKGMKFEVTTIDKMVQELNLPRVDFIKMDIEGSETRALIGARNTLAKYHPRISVAVYHQPDHAVEVPKAIRAAWSDYQLECGPCALANGRIRPDILYFH